MSGKYSQKLLDHAKQCAADVLFRKATGDLIGNNIADRITNVSKYSQRNNSETVKNELDKKYLKKDIYIQKVSWKLLKKWD